TPGWSWWRCEGADYLPLEPRLPGYALAILLVLVGGMAAVWRGGVLGDFMEPALIVLPFAVLAWLAYVGCRTAWGGPLALLWLAGLLFVTGVGTLGCVGPALSLGQKH